MHRDAADDASFQIATWLSSYWAQHSGAQDSAEGIANSWLTGKPAEIDAVRTAPDLPERKGVVRRMVATDGTVRYGARTSLG